MYAEWTMVGYPPETVEVSESIEYIVDRHRVLLGNQ